MTVPYTPSQTVGPFFHDGLLRPGEAIEMDPEAERDAIVLEGRVLDGRNEPVVDAMVELWRADPDRDDGAGVGLGWARSGTDASGTYRLRTLPPIALPHPSDVPQAPHLVLVVFARGLLDQLLTRAYPTDDGSLPDDPVLTSIPEGRRATLLAQRDGDVDGAARYRFDIRLQGDGETVFFEV